MTSGLNIVPGVGLLTFCVWPSYMGAATGDPGIGWVPDNEPFYDINYSRGLIDWKAQKDGNILGQALVFVPKGVYSHFIFCGGPLRHGMIGKRILEQPIVMDRAGIIEIAPIRNQDYLPRQPV